LPHPRLHKRSFVLAPLRDVAPDWRHPLLGQSIAEMRATLEAQGVERVGWKVPAPSP
jgi:2-amino-4-hydroxy-6-hydroxymethyldihydropteridine diphosphokinase